MESVIQFKNIDTLGTRYHASRGGINGEQNCQVLLHRELEGRGKKQESIYMSSDSVGVSFVFDPRSSIVFHI